MSIRPSENKALLTEKSRVPESLSRRLRRQSLSASTRWRKGNEEDAMFHEITPVQRREDGSIDHDHYRAMASQLRSEAIFDLFKIGLSNMHLRPSTMFAGSKQERTKEAAQHVASDRRNGSLSRSVDAARRIQSKVHFAAIIKT
jgi:hypothetical protein